MEANASLDELLKKAKADWDAMVAKRDSLRMKCLISKKKEISLESNLKDVSVEMKELKHNLTKMTLTHGEVVYQKAKVEEELSTYKRCVLKMHFEGFNQAICQMPFSMVFQPLMNVLTSTKMSTKDMIFQLVKALARRV